jgi:hypothetical protein
MSGIGGKGLAGLPGGVEDRHTPDGVGSPLAQRGVQYQVGQPRGGPHSVD